MLNRRSFLGTAAAATAATLTPTLLKATTPTNIRISPTVAEGFVKTHNEFLAAYHGDGVRAADLRSLLVVAEMMQTELKPHYSVINSHIINRTLIEEATFSSVNTSEMLKYVRKVVPSAELSDVNRVYSREFIPQAKSTLLSQGVAPIVSGYIESLKAAEAALGSGLLRAGYGVVRSQPQVEKVGYCLYDILGDAAGGLGLVALFCPECDVAIATISIGALTITVTAGGLAATLGLVYSIESQMGCTTR